MDDVQEYKFSTTMNIKKMSRFHDFPHVPGNDYQCIEPTRYIPPKDSLCDGTWRLVSSLQIRFDFSLARDHYEYNNNNNNNHFNNNTDFQYDKCYNLEYN